MKLDNYYKVAPDKIQVREGFNARKSHGDLKELKQSIRESGVKEALHVSKEGSNYVLGSQGHRRLKAVMELIAEGVDIKTVPVQLEPEDMTDEQRTLDILVLNNGKPLEFIEEAEVFQRVLDMHKANVAIGDGSPESVVKYEKEVKDTLAEARKDLANRTGKTVQHIVNCELLLTAPKSVLRRVVQGRIAASLVIDLIRDLKSDMDAVQDAVEEAVAEAERGGKKKATRKNVKVKKSKAETNGDGKEYEEDEEAIEAAKEDKAVHKRVRDLLDKLGECDRKALDKNKIDLATTALQFALGVGGWSDVKAELKIDKKD